MIYMIKKRSTILQREENDIHNKTNQRNEKGLSEEIILTLNKKNPSTYS